MTASSGEKTIINQKYFVTKTLSLQLFVGFFYSDTGNNSLLRYVLTIHISLSLWDIIKKETLL